MPMYLCHQHKGFIVSLSHVIILEDPHACASISHIFPFCPCFPALVQYLLYLRTSQVLGLQTMLSVSKGQVSLTYIIMMIIIGTTYDLYEAFSATLGSKLLNVWAYSSRSHMVLIIK